MIDGMQTPPTRLALVRHGESVVTVERTIGGVRTCRGLSALGRRQAERLRDRLADGGELRADLLVSSDFRRAIETAEILHDGLATTGIEQRPGLGEHDPGPEIDGMTFDEYVDRFGTPDWHGDPHVEVFPGGETAFDFHERVRRDLDELVAANPGATVLVSCHGGVVDAAFRYLLGLPMTGGFELHTINTSITEFVGGPEGRWRLERYNDAAHLVGLPAASPRD